MTMSFPLSSARPEGPPIPWAKRAYRITCAIACCLVVNITGLTFSTDTDDTVAPLIVNGIVIAPTATPVTLPVVLNGILVVSIFTVLEELVIVDVILVSSMFIAAASPELLAAPGLIEEGDADKVNFIFKIMVPCTELAGLVVASSGVVIERPENFTDVPLTTEFVCVPVKVTRSAALPK